NSAGENAWIGAVDVCFTEPFAVTLTVTAPVISSAGVSTLTCVGLMKYTNASFPFTVTLVPSSDVGSLSPTMSFVAHGLVPVARFDPKILTQVFGAMPGAPLAEFETPELGVATIIDLVV